MTIYKRRAYKISIEAADYLSTLFGGLRPHNHSPYSPGVSFGFDNQTIANKSSMSYANGTKSMSHSLNVLAWHSRHEQWIDNRTTMQLQSCIQQLTPPVFHTHQEARDYYATWGYPTGNALWSNTSPKIDQEFPHSHPIHLQLSNHARDYYYKLAVLYKMRSLTAKNYHSKENYIAACLEAIGCQWLLPPEGYMALIANIPNPNIQSAHSRVLKRGKATNLERFAPENLLTQDKLRQMMHDAIKEQQNADKS